MSTPKLTKKQKKSLAFYRKGKAPRDVPLGDQDMEGNSVPALEDQDQADDDAASPTLALGKELDGKVVSPSNGKKKAKDPAAVAEPPAKKRKREQEEAGVEAEPKPKKAKQQTSGGDGEGATKGKVKQRFILFVARRKSQVHDHRRGNQEPFLGLRHVSSSASFSALMGPTDPPPTVRLRTPKPSASGKPTIKSKGCAFVEFSHRNALQQGLKLHQSELEGRRINVELTVGGGGSGETRIQKLKERNKSLHGERKDRLEKLAKTDPAAAAAAPPERPQRFSATSGLEQTAMKRRTWAVADEDDGETHRGGKRHSKKRGGKAKAWGTGVNAIPVTKM
ncbi:RRM domain-containing protein [Mycena chlorophos]|uniref:RRM domain-containing protein n=1 Tax=Mycena chlorophos TaxID=658473 RepID=A0A8H6WAR1_MYCCL|nr:RRM domain-containing protein [Mycena chlorophos]